MGILTRVRVRNFKCFRDWVEVDLRQSTYLAGANNSGKTALLAALACFFENDPFSPDYINKTELAARKEGFNRSDIQIDFDLTLVTGRVRRERMIEEYGEALAVIKSFTWREASESLGVTFRIAGAGPALQLDEVPDDVRRLLDSVAVSYIHPQEGVALLRKAQEKFKQRLFHNWGRHASVAERVGDVQEKWAALRVTANSYLSSALSTKLKEIWPGAEVRVDLPDRIQDIVAVSDITFRSSPNLPQVTLTSHGTGAQSAILYQTHYLLDSDRTLHQGMYFPVWLLEEPESFLHADIALQLSRLLSSSEWLGSIQMLISTHSPIILAGSRQAEKEAAWVVLSDHAVSWQSGVSDLGESEVAAVGELMGDCNFSVYFDAASSEPRVFLEDKKSVVVEQFRSLGLPIAAGLGGVSAIARYLDVLVSLGGAVAGEIYFVADSDRGADALKRFIKMGTVVKKRHGWRSIEVVDRVYLVLLPKSFAVEDLFVEFDGLVEEVVELIFDDELELRESIPMRLSRAASAMRAKPPESWDDARDLLRRQQDVKGQFWASSEGLQFAPEHVEAIGELIQVIDD